MSYPMRDVIGPASPWCLGLRGLGWNWVAAASASYPLANNAYLVPLQVTEQYNVASVWWFNGTAIDVGSDVDVGVYDEDFSRIFSIGTTVQSGAAAVQRVNKTTTTLDIGKYWMALACDDTGSDFASLGFLTATRIRVSGFLQAGSSFPLPATISSPVYPTDNFCPIFGISNRTW